jgi:hypothetical protein
MPNVTSPAATPARKNIRLWQSHNLRRWDMEKDVLSLDQRAPFVCECTSDACVEVIELTMQEFEAAHMCPSWSVVRPGHVLADDASSVRVRHPHYWVVELSTQTRPHRRQQTRPEGPANGAVSNRDAARLDE